MRKISIVLILAIVAIGIAFPGILAQPLENPPIEQTGNENIIFPATMEVWQKELIQEFLMKLPTDVGQLLTQRTGKNIIQWSWRDIEISNEKPYIYDERKAPVELSNATWFGFTRFDMVISENGAETWHHTDIIILFSVIKGDYEIEVRYQLPFIIILHLEASGAEEKGDSDIRSMTLVHEEASSSNFITIEVLVYLIVGGILGAIAIGALVIFVSGKKRPLTGETKEKSRISKKRSNSLRMKLDEDYVEDRISREEYLRRKSELEEM
jgi:hypothetical protein